MNEIRFDSNCLAWTRDLKNNEFFIYRQIDYFLEKLRYKGYLYLNDIYETFGAVWNPENENVCFRNADDFLVAIEKTSDGGYIIKLH